MSRHVVSKTSNCANNIKSIDSQVSNQCSSSQFGEDESFELTDSQLSQMSLMCGDHAVLIDSSNNPVRNNHLCSSSRQ
jgi:hypothetical protein